MIKLNKNPRPQILINKGSEWTSRLMKHIRNGTDIPDSLKGNYKHVEIKNEVILETKEKCMYCESYVTHLYPGDVEHIIPKSVYPRLTFSWNNLSFVCSKCNNNKNDFLDRSYMLLNPYKDEINKHLKAFGPLIIHINNSKRGQITEKKLDLNRKALRDKRTDSIQNLQNLIDKYEDETISSLKQILKQEIIDYANIDKEYSFILREYLVQRGII